MDSADKFPVIRENYNFACTLCGNCCSGVQDVLLDWYDLYRMARFLEFENTARLFKAGLVELRTGPEQLRLPYIRFKQRPYRFCPFLENHIDDDKISGLCRLHPGHKPLVCGLAPVSRTIDFENDQESWHFVKPAPDCPGVDSSQVNSLAGTIQTWSNELAYQTRFFHLLYRLSGSGKQFADEWFIRRLYNFDCQISFERQMQKAIEQIVQEMGIL